MLPSGCVSWLMIYWLTHGWERSRSFSDENVPVKTFRLEVGETHGVEKRDIVGAIANEAGIDSKYMGKIYIHEDYSTIDLPQNMTADVLSHLRKIKVRGQNLNIREASGEDFKKSERPDKRKSYASDKREHKDSRKPKDENRFRDDKRPRGDQRPADENRPKDENRNSYAKNFSKSRVDDFNNADKAPAKPKPKKPKKSASEKAGIKKGLEKKARKKKPNSSNAKSRSDFWFGKVSAGSIQESSGSKRITRILKQ